MYQIPELLEFPHLFHAFSTKDNGNMANSILGHVGNFSKTLTNRQNFLSSLNVDIDKTACMWVTHEDGVIELNPKDLGISIKDFNHAIKVDSLTTHRKNSYLFLLIADCLPVILFDPKNEVIGLMHYGWKNADINLATKVATFFKDKYNTDPSNLIVGFGPAARKDSFIKESPSQVNDPEWQTFLKKVDSNKYKVDFVGLCKKQLVDNGILEKNIFDCKIDTVKDERFFSHVREGKLPIGQQGRFACVVGLRG